MLIFEIIRPQKRKENKVEVKKVLTAAAPSLRVSRECLKAKLCLSPVATKPFVLGKTTEFDFVLLPEITRNMLCILIYPIDTK